MKAHRIELPSENSFALKNKSAGQAERVAVINASNIPPLYFKSQDTTDVCVAASEWATSCEMTQIPFVASLDDLISKCNQILDYSSELSTPVNCTPE